MWSCETVHVGTQLPTGWGRGTLVMEMPTGRPENEAAMTMEEFKAARKAHGLTQMALGKLIGKSEETVRRYERGKLSVPEEVWRAMEAQGLLTRSSGGW